MFCPCILPNERLQRQVYANRLVGVHERCTSLGISEDEKLGRPQRQTGLCRSHRMVDSKRITNFFPELPSATAR
jgi:hypothetical protein